MLDKKILEELKKYIEGHLNRFEVLYKSSDYESYPTIESSLINELEDYIENNRRPTLKHVLFSFIDKKGVSDAEIYKKAGIDRKLFSKIRSIANYKPKRNTLIALALALELEKIDFDLLLSSAGYTLSDTDTYDLVIQFCLERNIYDIHEVNEALDYFSLKPLSGVL